METEPENERQLGRKGRGAALAVDGPGNLSPLWLIYDLDCGASLTDSSLRVSDIGCSAWCLASDLWSLTLVDLVSVIQTTRSRVKSVTSFFCLSHLFKPLYMNDSS